ncbi:Extended synaptotagmin-2-B [Dirofilaria immitis]
MANNESIIGQRRTTTSHRRRPSDTFANKRQNSPPSYPHAPPGTNCACPKFRTYLALLNPRLPSIPSSLPTFPYDPHMIYNNNNNITITTIHNIINNDASYADASTHATYNASLLKITANGTYKAQISYRN